MITIKNLTKTFLTGNKPFAALKGVDLEIAEGEFFVLLGPSGSGKTTLLRSVAGLETPDGGEILLDNRTMFSAAKSLSVPSEQRRLGMVFQSYAIWPHLTVSKNIALPLTHGVQKLSKADVEARIAKALAAVQLEAFADRPAPMLSGGQQQRVALARALAIEPKALLMDEPLSNLDARLREEIRVEIKATVSRIGITVMYVTHDQSEAMALADRIAVMDQGEIVQIGAPAQLYNKPATPHVAEFFGSINWLSGNVKSRGSIETRIGNISSEAAFEPSAVRLGVRPEDIRFQMAPTSSVNEYRGRTLDTTFFGDHQIHRVDINGEILIVKTAGQDFIDCAGRDAYLHIPGQRVLLYQNP